MIHAGRSHHPTPETLQAFMRGELARAEVAGIVRHLLTGCPLCVAVTGRFWRMGERPRVLQILLEEMKALESSGPRWPGHSRPSLY